MQLTRRKLQSAWKNYLFHVCSLLIIHNCVIPIPLSLQLKKEVRGHFYAKKIHACVVIVIETFQPSIFSSFCVYEPKWIWMMKFLSNQTLGRRYIQK